MKKKLLSLFLLATIAMGTFAGCSFGSSNDSNSESSVTETPIEKIDYVALTPLDMDSDTAKLEIIPTDKNGRKNYIHIDGDTTHFKVDKDFDSTGTFKARYLAVDTPESTGDVEEWGKKASAFTKERLDSATSIILESDTNEWNKDTNQRYLAWVWYKTEGSDTYRNLNLELLNEGLAINSRTADCRYDEVCNKAALQAQKLKLFVYSSEKDPDYYYGASIETTLKEIREDIDAFTGKRVVFYGIVTAYKSAGSIYVEDYDEETGRTYALPIFYGKNHPDYDPLLAEGNEVRIAGEITYSENFGYQMSALRYNIMDPNHPENIKVISKNNTPIYMTPTVEEFTANNYAYAIDHLYSSVSMENLTVYDVYTTVSEKDSNGAMTLYCRDANGKEIEIRTNVLKDVDTGDTITKDRFLNKTINVRGIIEDYTYNNKTTYQVEVYTINNIDILN